MPGSSATQLGAIALDIGEDDDPPLTIATTARAPTRRRLAGNSGWFSSPIAVVQFLLFGWVISLTSGLTSPRQPQRSAFAADDDADDDDVEAGGGANERWRGRAPGLGDADAADAPAVGADAAAAGAALARGRARRRRRRAAPPSAAAT